MLIENAGEVLALMSERYSGTARTGGTEARYSQVLHVSIKRSKTRAYSALRGAARMERRRTGGARGREVRVYALLRTMGMCQSS